MNFTFDGNPAAEAVIQQHQSLVIAAVRSVVPAEKLAAIVMIGGYGREEGAYVIDDDGIAHPYNDYDYFLVFRDCSRDQAWQYIRTLPDLEHDTGIDVDFFPLFAEELPKLEYSLMNAEMRAGHAVIWGDVNVLDAMPDMPLGGVAPAEFRRLLTNRGCLLLMNRLSPDGEHLSKYINKAWLAIGDAALARAGAYRLSYLLKRESIIDVLGDSTLTRNYQRAIDLRLRPDCHVPWQSCDMPAVIEAWSAAMAHYPSGSSADSMSERMLNVLRHLKDRKLPSLDAEVLSHPRLRVTRRLPGLLRDDREGWEQAATSTLETWAEYS